MGISEFLEVKGYGRLADGKCLDDFGTVYPLAIHDHLKYSKASLIAQGSEDANVSLISHFDCLSKLKSIKLFKNIDEPKSSKISRHLHFLK